MIETEEIQAFLDTRFNLSAIEAEDKLCSLHEAMRRHVKKGMSISFAVIEDPFVPGEKIELMRALRADIALVHGAAADRCGNRQVWQRQLH